MSNFSFSDAKNYIGDTRFASVFGLDTVRELLVRLKNPQKKLKFVHVAGTNGKGSVCAMLASVLSTAGYKVGVFSSPSVFRYLERIRLYDGDKTPASCEGAVDCDDAANCEGAASCENSVNRKCPHSSSNSVSDQKEGKKEATLNKFADDYADISESDFIRLVAEIKPHADAMEKDGHQHPTSFEMEFAVALLYFAEKSADIVILEVGMGGRLDATNIIDAPLLTVITSIGFDHTEYLGKTISEIASEKAAVIKHGTRLVVGPQKHDAALSAILKKAKSEDAAVEVVKFSEPKFTSQSTAITINGQHYVSALLGAYQAENTATAVYAINELSKCGFKISKQQLDRGLNNAVWQGRFEVIKNSPTIILDGAHNEAGAESLKTSLEAIFPNRAFKFLFCTFKDKNWQKSLDILSPLADEFFVSQPYGDRAQEKEVVAGYLIAKGKKATVLNLCELNQLYSELKKSDILVICGTLSVLADAKKALNIS